MDQQPYCQMSDIYVEELPPYVFEPLNGPEYIRVLELHRTTRDQLELTIRQIKISDGGYHALSYVWGSEDRPFGAIVRSADGGFLGFIPLTTNLRDALCDLRDACEVRSKVFWIDQISIDQEGAEKSQQVAVMGQIYAKADLVITYLGPAGSKELQKRGCELLNEIYSHFSPDYGLLLHDTEDSFIALESENRSNFPVRELPKSLSTGINDHEWEWLVQVAFGEWTTRLWILQEQVLNPQNIMLRGTKIIEWYRAIALAILFYLEFLPLKHVYHFWRRKGYQLYPSQVAYSLYLMWKDRHLSASGIHVRSNPAKKLLENIGWYWTLKCRDPRDRIYALMAISSDITKLCIVPDYSNANTVSRLFTTVTAHILRDEQDLATINLACFFDNSSNPHHPSWALNVPRSDDLIPSNLASIYYSPHPRREVSLPPRLNYEDLALTLNGRLLDRVRMSTPPVYYPNLVLAEEDYMKPVSAMLQNLSQILLALGISIENTAALSRVMVNTPMWTSFATASGSSISGFSFHFWSYFRSLAYWLVKASARFGTKILNLSQFEAVVQSMATLPGIARDGKNVYSCGDPLSDQEDEADDTIRAMLRVQGRSLCITEGERICSGMNEVREGDVVAALDGGHTLYILRPVGDRYRLIGDAHVDGWMFGEAYEGLDPDEVDYDITLI
jgi:hypothetical protein